MTVFKRVLGRIGLHLVVLAFGCAVLLTAAPAIADKPENPDKIALTDGRTLEGEVLEETDEYILFRVWYGSISTKMRFLKSEVSQITRGELGSDVDDSDPAAEESEADLPVIYMIELNGIFGRDVSYTPLEDVLEDAKDHQPDVIVLKFDLDFKNQFGQDIPENYPINPNAFFELDIARSMGVLLVDDIRADPEWEKKPRLVAWVNRAMGAAAFLPFVCPEVYFTTEGLHGRIGDLDSEFGFADAVVREKWRAAILGIAKGLAEKGGHESRLVMAMARKSYVLSYSLVGGEPRFYTDFSGDTILADDGVDERADTGQDIVRMRGNDLLTLDAPTAFRIGFSDGTVDNVDDLVFALGFTRGYTLIEEEASDTFEDWSRSVDNSVENLERLWKEFSRIEVQGDYQERARARGQMLAKLRDIRGILSRHGESIKWWEIDASPEGWDQQVELMIERIRTAQRLDRR